jgi:GNAT superfamily N-acetyltransferase
MAIISTNKVRIRNMKRFIKDRDGEKYPLKAVKHPDGTIHLELTYRGDYVGLVKWTLHPSDIMEVNDLHIRDDSEPPIPGESVMERLIKQARLEGEIKNYRRKGLGTELLKSLLVIARENQVKQVRGSIIKLDIIRTPNLIEWYEKRGFRKGPSYPGCSKNAIAWIYLDLD